MNKIITKDQARKFYYGSALCSFLVFFILSFDSISSLQQRDDVENITPLVAKGKIVWEEHNCISCHSLLGDGSYYAPELGNVYKRRGSEYIKAWIKMMPTNIEGRRKMPNFEFSNKELEALIAFLKWTSEINTSRWPPNIEG